MKTKKKKGHKKSPSKKKKSQIPCEYMVGEHIFSLSDTQILLHIHQGVNASITAKRGLKLLSH
jgi:hypothetical protein